MPDSNSARVVSPTIEWSATGQTLPDAALGTETGVGPGDWAEELDADGSAGWKRGAPRYTRLITALWHVNSYEAEHGRPMVGAFAVSRSTGHSGDGFMKLRRELGLPVPANEDGTGRATWREVIGECIEHWQSPASQAGTGTGMTDAQFDAIMGELSKIKQMIRQLMHG
jgi:hypothetical protein